MPPPPLAEVSLAPTPVFSPRAAAADVAAAAQAVKARLRLEAEEATAAAAKQLLAASRTAEGAGKVNAGRGAQRRALRSTGRKPASAAEAYDERGEAAGSMMMAALWAPRAVDHAPHDAAAASAAAGLTHGSTRRNPFAAEAALRRGLAAAEEAHAEGPKRRALLTDAQWLADYDSKYTPCAAEGGDCECYGSVHYGGGGVWVTKDVFGTFGCTDAFFGLAAQDDAAYNKSCVCSTAEHTAEAMGATMAESVRESWEHGTPANTLEYLEYTGDEMEYPDEGTGLTFTLHCAREWQLRLSAVVQLRAGISASVFVGVGSASVVPWVLRATVEAGDDGLSVETMDAADDFMLAAGDTRVTVYAREAGTRLVAVGLQPHAPCRWLAPEPQEEEGLATLARDAVTRRGDVKEMTTAGGLEVVHVTAGNVTDSVGNVNCADSNCTYPESRETMLAFSIYCHADSLLKLHLVYQVRGMPLRACGIERKLQALARICHTREAYLHTDGVSTPFPLVSLRRRRKPARLYRRMKARRFQPCTCPTRGTQTNWKRHSSAWTLITWQ
jgi:hypothetical protein